MNNSRYACKAFVYISIFFICILPCFAQDNVKEYRLSLQVVTSPQKVFSLNPFTYGLKVTNLSDQAFEGGQIYDISLTSMRYPYANTAVGAMLNLGRLNARETQYYTIGKIILYFPDGYWLRCKIKSDTGKNIATYQYNPMFNDLAPENNNSWMNLIVVHDPLLEAQNKMNKYLLLVSILMLFSLITSIYNTFVKHNNSKYYKKYRNIIGWALATLSLLLFGGLLAAMFL